MSCVNQQLVLKSGEEYTFAGPFKYDLVYTRSGVDSYIPIPCGSCDFCKLKRSQLWAARCSLESLNWLFSYFVTLTYDDLNLPIVESYNSRTGEIEKRSNLVVEHIQKFVRALRKRGYQLKYLASGEYGSSTERAHYHMIIFTNKPFDLEYYKLNENDQVLYTSNYLSDIWNRGFVVVGDFSPETAAYVARYTLKKVTKQKYSFLKSKYKQEFIIMSKGIGVNNVLDNLNVIEKIKHLNYSFNKKVTYIPLWRSVLDKLEKLGYQDKVARLRQYYRQQAEMVNKINKVGFDNYFKKIFDLKYCFVEKVKKLNNKL